MSDKKTHKIFSKARLCKAFRCLPSQLRREDPNELETIGEALRQMDLKEKKQMFGALLGK